MAKSTSSKTRRSGGSSVFTGVLIGLIVGAVLAVGVALWVTGNNPFSSESAEKAPAKPEVKPPATPETAPSFDFYKVLPGDAPTELPAAHKTEAASAVLYLQVGAFQNPNDADNLKAQLALLGIETAIQTSNQGDKGVFHRVRVGPFHAMDEVERTRELLTQNNIPATLVKEIPTNQEKP
jgi:cell division protein FtsN